MLSREDRRLAISSVLLCHLDEKEAGTIIDQCLTREFETGELIYETGSSPQQIFLILDGVIQLFRGSYPGRRAVLGIRIKGDVAGLTAVLSRKSHYATAKSVRNCKALVVPSAVLQNLLERSPKTGDHLVQKVADNILDISQHMERLQLLQTTERLADYFLQKVGDETTSVELDLPCDKGLIATYLGMERESFSRALAKLRQVGVLSKGRTIQITDPTALRAFRNGPG